MVCGGVNIRTGAEESEGGMRKSDGTLYRALASYIEKF